MDTIRGFVTARRAFVGAVAVLIVAGVAWGVMNRGPSDAQRAYALACEAIRAKLPEDQRETAVFPEIGDEGVEVHQRNFGWLIESRVNQSRWIGSVSKSGFINCHFSNRD